MSRYCLDTSAYSRFQRGEGSVVDLIDSASWLGLPAIVLGELWTGFLRGSQPERNAGNLREFVGHSVVEVIAIDEEIARIYGEIVNDLREQGRPLPTNDVWIAAAAIRSGAPVLTFDSHFESISRVGTRLL